MLRLIILLFTTLSLSTVGISQTLKTTSLNLNVGGVIHDVEYVPFLNIYVVVGKFTSINGLPRINMAYIDATTFTVKNSGLGFNPITSVKGADNAFRSVEYYDSGTEHILMVGGAFDTINGVRKSCLFAMNRPYGATATSFFNHVNYDYDMMDSFEVFWGYNTPSDPTIPRGVYDMKFAGDTLLIAGSYSGINVMDQFTLTPTHYYGDSYIMLKWDANTSNTSQFIHLSTTGFCGGDCINSNDCSSSSASNTFAHTLVPSGNSVYVGGGFAYNDKYFKKLDKSVANCSTDAQYNTCMPSAANFNTIDDMNVLNDSIIIANGLYWMGTTARQDRTVFLRTKTPFYTYLSNPTAFYTVSGYAQNSGPDANASEAYNGDAFIYLAGSNPKQLNRYSVSGSGGTINLTQVGTSIPFNATVQVANAQDSINNLMVENRYLFLSENGLTQVNGQTRTGLAVFCLEPSNPRPFIAPDLTACQGDTITYTIPDVQYETGYKWTYSGTGIEYSINGAAFVPYTVPVMNTTAGATSIKIHFLNNATSGTLTVEPYNTCNTTMDYLYAKPQSVVITVNPKPVLNFNAPNTQFTCIVDTITIVATSSIPTVNYQWAYPNPANPLSTNDSITIFGTGSPSVIYPDGTYYVTITEPSTGCSAKGSIVVTENTTPPTISQDSLTITPQLFTCTDNQMVLSAEVQGASIYWTTQADTSVHFTNPHTIYPTDPTAYWAFAVDNVNGCKSQQEYLVQSDYTTIEGYLPDYSSYPAQVIVDTINCFTPSLSISCGILPSDPNAAYGSVHWIQNGTTDLALTTSDSTGMFMNTQTYRFVTLNSQTGCTDSSDVTVYFDLNFPFVSTYNGAHTINCSVDTLTMVHLQTGGNMTEGWLDGTGTQTGSNSVFVNGTGTYIYGIVDNINGCSNADTVTVSQTSEMYLSGTSDTIVCPASQVTVSVAPVNVSESVTYLWSNGDTGSSTSLIGGADSLVSVIATTSGGCVGYDTIHVDITAPVAISVAGFVSCGSGSGSLQITNVSGGAGSYLYSIDGTNYSSALLFDSLSPGNYSISVKDALGCVYSFIETLDASASAPDMNFLVSTYSEKSDTLVVVNNSIYQGFDSVQWVFPPNINVIYLSDSVAFIQALDTGWVSITLIGFEDTCQYSLTKSIYSGTSAPVYPSSMNSVNIQSINAYPNPTTGAFTVDVVFGIEQNYAVVVANELGQLIDGMTASGRAISFSSLLNFPSGLEPGSYHVYVLSDYDARELTIILN